MRRTLVCVPCRCEHARASLGLLTYLLTHLRKVPRIAGSFGPVPRGMRAVVRCCGRGTLSSSSPHPPAFLIRSSSASGSVGRPRRACPGWVLSLECTTEIEYSIIKPPLALGWGGVGLGRPGILPLAPPLAHPSWRGRVWLGGTCVLCAPSAASQPSPRSPVPSEPLSSVPVRRQVAREAAHDARAALDRAAR